uniref:NADH-ubiquinone oxidoreductase chain 6 n=2 Tax=Gecarcoidea TaxID=45627 RepID=A0A3B8CLQ7_9EUCA|nr:NADH dehydrogenase subunit 6 [Gecarcoidea natalis]YP_010164079.1 NADH dehydrogenase subunit 6 [Gecarcoidea lalandii]AYJ22392.1 NADH dehydrogenase subunit 6 [Gecarcoidea natalis]QRK27381.1 NADH dehydrogenase subunit 6 [Gecarcoidea lalandii]
MLMLTMPLLITFSILFTQLYHPLAMGLMLLIQTILISITVGISTYSFWFSYILFLVFLGGMLVLFIYVASLASNEPFIFKSYLLFISFFSISISFMFLLLDPFLIMNSTSLPTSSIKSLTSTPFIISWIYNTPSMAFTIFIISYLLLMLIVVVKIVNLFKGPLRLTQ